MIQRIPTSIKTGNAFEHSRQILGKLHILFIELKKVCNNEFGKYIIQNRYNIYVIRKRIAPLIFIGYYSIFEINLRKSDKFVTLSNASI